MKYEKKSFSVAPGEKVSAENWERIFGKKGAKRIAVLSYHCETNMHKGCPKSLDQAWCDCDCECHVSL